MVSRVNKRQVDWKVERERDREGVRDTAINANNDGTGKNRAVNRKQTNG